MTVVATAITSLPLLAAFVGLFLALSFYFSGCETAFFSLQQVQREHLEREGGATGRQAASLLQHRASLIATILLGNETVNIVLSAVTAGAFAAMLPGYRWLNIVVLTPVLVLFSEITPKVLALRLGTKWVRWAVWPLTLVYYTLAVPRLIMTAIVQRAGRLFGVDSQDDQGMAADELMVYVDDGAQSGALAPLERDMIEAVIELDSLTLERMMTPRPDVFSLPLDTPWQDLLEAAAGQRHSRIPITGATPDDLIGVLLLKDLLRFRDNPPSSPFALRAHLLPPVFVPATKAADSMLDEFLERRLHMAFVVDEHGTFVGLVTLDDLLDELLGDDEEDEEEIAQLSPQSLTVKASIDVDDFVEETAIKLPDGDYHTLGGFVFHELGRLPAKGDTVLTDTHRFVVAEMVGRRISEVVVTPHSAPENSP